MKSHEFITENDAAAINKDIDDAMNDKTKRLAKLKAEIEGGLAPIIHNSSGGSDPSKFYFNDLEALGWAEKEYTHDYSGEVDGWVRYYSHKAPGPIRVHTSGAKELAVWKPGHQEED